MLLLFVGILALQNARLFHENERMQQLVAGERKGLVEAYILLGEKSRKDNEATTAEEYFRKAREVAGHDPGLLSLIPATPDHVAGR
jgi:hypothetical protein